MVFLRLSTPRVIATGAATIPLMPELPELEVVQEVLNRRILGQTVVSADVIPPGCPIVVRDLTGEGCGTALAGARFESVTECEPSQTTLPTGPVGPNYRKIPHNTLQRLTWREYDPVFWVCRQ